MDAFLVSTGIVALAEIGDKTQLLAFLLAARFRRPLPIVFGIFVATIFNHAFAAAVGALVSELLGPNTMRWVLGLSFLGMAAWILVPDEIDDEETSLTRHGVFLTTLIAFSWPRWATRPRSPPWPWPRATNRWPPSSPAPPSA